jgi:hypothetical protein
MACGLTVTRDCVVWKLGFNMDYAKETADE